MKSDKLQVGVDKPFKFNVEIDYEVPETLAECQSVATEGYIVSQYVRGDRIATRAFAAQDFGPEFLNLLKLRGWKRAEDVSKEDIAKLTKVAAAKAAEFKRDGSRQDSTKIATLSKKEYDALPESVRQTLAAQGVKIILG